MSEPWKSPEEVDREWQTEVDRLESLARKLYEALCRTTDPTDSRPEDPVVQDALDRYEREIDSSD